MYSELQNVWQGCFSRRTTCLMSPVAEIFPLYKTTIKFLVKGREVAIGKFLQSYLVFSRKLKPAVDRRKAIQIF